MSDIVKKDTNKTYDPLPRVLSGDLINIITVIIIIIILIIVANQHKACRRER